MTVDLKNIKTSLADTSQIVIIFAVFSVGIFSSVLISKEREFIISIVSNFNNYCSALSAIIILLNILTVLFLFYSGLNLAGKSLIYVIILLYGYFSAALLAIMYNYNQTLCFASIMPSAIFSSFTHICEATQSLYVSKDLYDSYIKKMENKTEIKTYLKRYILMLIIQSISGAYLILSLFFVIRFVI